MLRIRHGDGLGNLAWTIGWVTFGSILLSVAVAGIVAVLTGASQDWRHYLFAIGVPLITTPIWAFPLVRAFQRATRAHACSEQLALTDPLTELPNRRAFFERAEHVLSRPGADMKRVAVFMVDVDRFKTINDGFGHHAGDTALCDVAAALNRVALRLPPACKALVARLGGDEFTVLVSNMPLSSLAAFASEACREVRRTIREMGAAQPLTVSIGFALREQGEGIDAVVRAADRAAYEAKRAGRDQWRQAPPRYDGAPLFPHLPVSDAESDPNTECDQQLASASPAV